MICVQINSTSSGFEKYFLSLLTINDNDYSLVSLLVRLDSGRCFNRDKIKIWILIFKLELPELCLKNNCDTVFANSFWRDWFNSGRCKNFSKVLGLERWFSKQIVFFLSAYYLQYLIYLMLLIVVYLLLITKSEFKPRWRSGFLNADFSENQKLKKRSKDK